MPDEPAITGAPTTDEKTGVEYIVVTASVSARERLLDVLASLLDDDIDEIAVGECQTQALYSPTEDDDDAVDDSG